MRRRWTSWSKLRATGWSHGNVLAQFLSSSWVHRRNMARRHSLPIGRLWRIFNMSNKIVIGTENSTMDCNELTILNSNTEQSGMSYIECAWGFTDFFRERDWWRDITWGFLMTRGDSRGYPPWVHLFMPDPKELARVRDWWTPED